VRSLEEDAMSALHEAHSKLPPRSSAVLAAVLIIAALGPVFS
jgi:hypothetical protein